MDLSVGEVTKYCHEIFTVSFSETVELIIMKCSCFCEKLSLAVISDDTH